MSVAGRWALGAGLLEDVLSVEPCRVCSLVGCLSGPTVYLCLNVNVPNVLPL